MMKLRLLVQWCGLALLAGTVAGCGGTLGTDAPELRETTYGVVRGANNSAVSGTYAWKGIPFAQAPVGARRCGLEWRA